MDHVPLHVDIGASWCGVFYVVVATGMSESGIKDFNLRTGIRWDVIGEDMDTLTNRHALSAFDPRINALTYVYDSFKWEHCEADGFDFDDAWGDTATISRSPVFKKGQQ